MATRDKYRGMLANLAGNFTDEEAQALAFELCTSPGDRCKVSNGRQLITELERIGLITPNKLDEFYKVLKDRKFNVAASVLEDYKVQQPDDTEKFADKSPSKRVDEEFLKDLTKKLGRVWREVGRNLKGIEEEDLDVLAEEHSKNVREAIRQMLRQWWEDNGPEATYEALGEALQKAGRRDLQELTRTYAETH